ncbi:MAG TPA: Crp/Fnr family transcriptional regulator [Chlorobaculum sp.]|uniref:Transcriptional regulator, Crp/Fnr family n=1 Tax=Chlorobaculum tepidum (strain ATCC 49652 / DSM 12025 / NBRC 103806 / TLS) TaxID=194439 RepID=Q8KBR5_CHLTE|nr:Crp/Fnr family transcriptional regulator [Chlorobaculum tepidum]AAM72942.1 transcriptional regulator, Crp/Fnr family [Chlorobaculum tepidum TLS]HBU22569.1 Crp/Fnr family transcriptional regulator [Chlorobaculum sp.]
MSLDNNKGKASHATRQILEKYLTLRSFRKGQLLWSEGDTDGLLVFLKSGRVKIYRLLPMGKAITLYIFGKGSVFGFMPFFDDAPYPAYAQALDDCEADVISRSGLRQAVHQDPEVAIVLMKQLAQRLRDAFDTIERLQSKGANPKVAAALMALMDDSPNIAGRPLFITLPVASHEFAQSLGLTPETLSRSITHLVEKNILKRLQRNRFQILDLEALEKVAESALR